MTSVAQAIQGYIIPDYANSTLLTVFNEAREKQFIVLCLERNLTPSAIFYAWVRVRTERL